MTTARFFREFVGKHPEYKHDSIISDNISYDLLETCNRITRGEESCPELLMTYDTKTGSTIPTAMEKAEDFLDGKAQKPGHHVTNGATAQVNA